MDQPDGKAASRATEARTTEAGVTKDDDPDSLFRTPRSMAASGTLAEFGA